MTNDQRRLRLLAIAASAAQTVAAATGMAQGASPEETARIHARTLAMLDPPGIEGPLARFNMLLGSVAGDIPFDCDLEIRLHGTAAERCATLVADMVRLSYAVIAASSAPSA